MSKSAKSKEKKELPQYATGGQVAGGALAGAATGAALGTAVPVIGNVVGAIGGGLIGGLGSLFGGGSDAPPVNLTQTVTPDQLAAANSAAQGTISQQQALANALASQGGIQNQSDVYNQQQGLANQLQAMANGQGPNVALSQLNQTTGQNIANQAALMASQRGAGTNPALIAKLAAQQGAATQQQAAGQAATERQQQQLAAISALQNQQQNLANLSTQQVNQQQNAVGNLNQYTLGQQQNLLNAATNYNQAQLAASGQAINQSQFAQGQTNQWLGAGLNAAGTLASSGVLGKGSNTGLASTDTGANSNMSSNTATPNDWAAWTGAKAAEGGEVHRYADGGQVANSINQSSILKENYSGPRSKVGKHLKKPFAKGGEVKALVSPGEIYLSPDKAEQVKDGEANPLDGEKIKGKAKVPGAKNSYANDTVKKTLKEGGIVLPRSVTQAKDPEAAAAKFIAALKSKKGK